jgi:hypothetical protein
MQVLLFITLLIAGSLLNFIVKARFKFVYKWAIAYILIALLLSLSSAVFYLARLKNVSVLKALTFEINWIDSLGHLMLGYLIMNIFLGLTSTEADEGQVKKILRITLWGITILTGLSFITETFWKAGHFGKMACFFNMSGYSSWFLYFIMAAEGLGGLGVLLHYKLKTGPIAAAGLMLIMIGALYTHCHNNDPLSESYPAICQFITLALMQAIYYFEQAANPKRSDLSLTHSDQTIH